MECWVTNAHDSACSVRFACVCLLPLLNIFSCVAVHAVMLGVLDYLHGTDVSFRSSEQYKRHKTYFSVDSYRPVAARARVIGKELHDEDVHK